MPSHMPERRSTWTPPANLRLRVMGQAEILVLKRAYAHRQATGEWPKLAGLLHLKVEGDVIDVDVSWRDVEGDGYASPQYAVR